VRDAADISLSVPYLDAILYLLGISSDDVAAGDR
jgi:phosphoserine phosphatase